MARTPLLLGELSESKQMALASMTSHPGYPVLEELFMAACDKVNKELIKLDPADDGYDQRVKALQSQARERNQFCLLILESIQWHKKVTEVAIEEKEVKPESNPILKGLK